MSVGVFPVFNPRIKGVVFGRDGKSLAEAIDSLDAISCVGGLSPFSGFMDNRPVPDGFDGDPDELDERLAPWDEWFEIADGLRTIDGVLATIASKNGEAGYGAGDEELVDELRELAECLRAVERGTTRFRLEVG